MSDNLWEKLLVVAACAIAATLAVVAMREEFVGHDAPTASPAAAALEPAEPSSSDVAGVVRPPAPNAQRRERAPAAPTPLDRDDCAAMRGTRLRTRGERQWFIDNCLFLARRAHQSAANGASVPRGRAASVQPGDDWRSLLRAAGFSLDEATPSRSALEVRATPPAWLSGHNAISLATDWMTSNSPVALVVEPAGCNSIWLNGHWVVTCRVGLAGCSGERCEASISFCVFSDPVVVPDLSC